MIPKPQPKEYTMTIIIKCSPEVNENHIEEHIRNQIFKKGWGEAFGTNYIHVDKLVFSHSNATSDRDKALDKVEKLLRDCKWSSLTYDVTFTWRQISGILSVVRTTPAPEQP